MDKFIIKIGADKMKELKEVFEHPEKAEKNVHTLFLDTSEDLYRLLSPQRIELLRRLIKGQAERKTISELARELGRKQEAISRDASFLEMHQMIKKIKKKRQVYLKPLFKSLDIRLAEA